MGLDPVLLPLFDIVPVAWSPPDPAAFDAITMTSANAARHGGAGLRRYRHLPLFAVGGATAAAARAAGFSDVRSGSGTARDLDGLLGNARVLHLAGTDHVALAGGSRTTAVCVYVAKPRAIGADEISSLHAPVVLVHSPRAGSALAAVVGERANMTIVAISPAAAHACGDGWSDVQAAPVPREAAMLATLARLCKANIAHAEGVR